VADATGRLVRLQKTHAQFWSDASNKLRNGRPLSTVMDGVWPAAAISAIRAGELNGSLVEVLDNLVQSIKIQRKIRKTAGKMLYPVGIIGASSVTFIVFMLTLVPSITEKLHKASGKMGELTGIAGFGLHARNYLVDNWILVTVVALVGVIGLVGWARSPKTIREATRIVIDLPLVGPALNSLCFGLWARYMAMSCRAGIATIEALKSTVDVLPEPLRPGVQAMVYDLEVRNLALDDAANPDKHPQTDPRHKWPFYVPHAFSIGERSGRIDVELERVAPELISAGEEEMERAIGVGTLIAMAFAAAVLGSTMILIYVPMMSGLSHMR
jgi:type II secretory pathway component PulF